MSCYPYLKHGGRDMKTVLLTNAQQRKTLVVARSLGKRGVRIITADETRLNPTGFSKYCYKSLVYPNIKKYPDKFYNWLVNTIKEYNCDVIFPMDEDSLEIIMKNYDSLSKMCRIPQYPPESYFIACDKGKQAALVKEAGIDLPETFRLKNIDELEEVSKIMRYPVFIKPRESSGSRGMRIVNSREELLEIYKIIHEEYPLPIIQEYIGVGDKYSVCLLFNKNYENLAAFVQKQVRNFPVDIGPSTIQQSVFYPELVEKALNIMRKLKLHGIVEIEFMVDKRDGKLKFLEINPRFWGSVYAATVAGIDFPWLLYKLAIGEKVEKHLDYKEGVYCRWLLPGDIFHFITNKNRKNMDPPFLAGKKLGVYDDIISKDDFMPVIGFLLACFRYAFDPKMWKFIFKR